MKDMNKTNEELDTESSERGDHVLMPLPEMTFQKSPSIPRAAPAGYMPIPASEAIALREIAVEKRRARQAMGRLILTAFLQVLLVSINVYQISHGHYVGAIIIGFGISLTWTFNIKSVAFGGWKERLVYSVSAAAGTLTGMILPQMYYGRGF